MGPFAKPSYGISLGIHEEMSELRQWVSIHNGLSCTDKEEGNGCLQESG